MSSASVIPASQLDNTFGCLFLALVFSSILWGIGTLQLYIYYEKYWDSDKSWLRLYITVVWLLDTAHQIILTQSCYVYFVTAIADQTLLTKFPKTVSSNAIIIPIIDAMVQVIFVRRAWYISNGNRLLTSVLCLAVLAQFAVNLTYFCQIHPLSEFSQLSKYIGTELALNSTVVFTDTLLASALIYLLWRSRSGMKRTDSVIKRLVAYTIGSGLATALWTLVALIGAAVAPHTFVYLLSDLVIPKLYFNCMLASLNARARLRGALTCGQGGMMSIHLENLPSSNSNSSMDDSRKAFGRRVVVNEDVECGSAQRTTGEHNESFCGADNSATSNKPFSI